MQLEPGFKRHRGGLLVPSESAAVVPPSKITAGLIAAKEQLSEMLEELTNFAGGFHLSEVELQVSFSADGKFLGVGVGGATSITLRVEPDG
jgi:hypothetical protein